jgi:hypothetical protein
MQAPDFAKASVGNFAHKDLLFLFEHFPVPGVDAVEAVRRVHEQPSTLESLLESRYVQDALCDRSALWLEVSPQLYFNVMLRHALPGPRDPLERRTIHYLANLLALFGRTERLYRPSDAGAPCEYLVDLVQQSVEAGYERRFLVDAHIANYALYLSGICAQWVQHRRRYRHRPVSLEYYRRMGRSYYASAAHHPASREFGLREIFARLAERFEHFRGGLERLAGSFNAPQRSLATVQS